MYAALGLSSIAFVSMAACSGSAPVAHPTNRSATGTLEDARAYERGRRVPRDYARAAELYAGLCRQGHGSIEACDVLIGWLIDARGVSRDIDAMIEILHELCQRGDVVSCADELIESAPSGGLVSDNTPPPPPDPVLERRMADVRAACNRNDGRACQLAAYELDTTDEASNVRRAKLLAIACDQGRSESCADLAEPLERCENTDEVADCESEQVANWKKTDPRAYQAAMTIIRACDDGDALACVHLPSKRIPLAARCAAHDYEACGMLGCLGDAKSDALAKQHAAEVNCRTAQRLGALEARQRTLPDAAHVTGQVDDPM